MNYDLDMINRALMRAGQETVTEEDKTSLTTKWRTVAGFYLSTYLTVISTADWTSLKTRAALTVSDSDNLTDYAYKYELPTDCAKAISIDDNDEFVIEGNCLYSDTADAVLLYVSNGKYTEVSELPTEKTEDEIHYKGQRYIWKEAEEEGAAGEYVLDENQDDIPEYAALTLSPELLQCLEYHLAAEISLKITGSSNLFGNLIQLATAIEDDARKTSRAKGVSQSKGSQWWAERLGLSTGDTENAYN